MPFGVLKKYLMVAKIEHMEDKIQEKLNEKLTEESIQKEFESTLQDRVMRYLKVKPHGIIPLTPFASASSECSKLFRDGHYYGCISLTQAVSEALVMFLCKTNGWDPDRKFERNVEKLFIRGKIKEKQKVSLLKIWRNRDDYHHLNSTVASNLSELENLAKQKLVLLTKLEGEIFSFSFNDGKLIPKQQKYWNMTDGKVKVFLRLD